MAEVYRPDPRNNRNAPKKGTPPRRKKKKLSPLGVIFVVITIIAVVVLLIWGCFELYVHYLSGLFKHENKTEEAKHYLTQVPEETETLDTSLPTLELPPELPDGKNNEGLPLICDTRDVKNYLLIGDQSRSSDGGHLSDTMILVSVNTRTKKILLNSVERDLLVKIPGRGQNKLNAAHAFGGPDLLMDTLKENFNIEVDKWFRVDFSSFVDIVDAVGGLDIEMDAAEIQIMNHYLVEINELYNRPKGTDNLDEVAGTYHLNGYQTLAYCRNRYSKPGGKWGSGSDFNRMDRQRKVIDLVIQKAKKDLSKAHSLLTTLLPMITTNMEREEIFSAMNEAIGYLSYDLVKDSVPAEGEWIGGAVDYVGDGKPRSVVLFKDKKASMNKLYTAIYGEEPQ